MCKTTLLVILLSCLCVGVGISQSTELSFKIGNNGNLSLNSKFKSGNCAELNRFGKGHQGGIEIRHDFMKKFGVKVEASYLNANMEIDLESSWPIESSFIRSSMPRSLPMYLPRSDSVWPCRVWHSICGRRISDPCPQITIS